MSIPFSRALRSASRIPRPQSHLPRTYATLSPYTPTPTAAYEVFDEPSKARQRDRALLRLRSKEGGGDTSVVDYLREGLLTKVLQEVIGNEHKGKERKWWMVEPSGEPTSGDEIELMG
jgi:hypothetical protein